jgi:hypothetical protein
MFRTLFGLILAGAIGAAQTPAKSTSTANSQISTGVLAVASDHDGALYVDGELRANVVSGKVVSLRLTAGQHFVDLRDSQGTKLWDEMVTVPAGAQAAEKIEVNSVTTPSNTQAGSVPCSLDSLNYFELAGLGRHAEALPLAPDQATKESSKTVIEVQHQVLAVAPNAPAALYAVGRYDAALRAASEEIEALKNFRPPPLLGETFVSSKNIQHLQSLSFSYELRGRVKYALKDVNGALSDLAESLEYASQGMVASRSGVLLSAPPEGSDVFTQNFPKDYHPSNKSEVLQEGLRIGLNQAHLTRARILSHERRFQDATSDTNEVLGFHGQTYIETQVLDAELIAGKANLYPGPTGCEASAARPQTATPSAFRPPISLTQEIEAARKDGRTTPFPAGVACRTDASVASGQARYKIKNSSAYSLRVLLSGPTEQDVRIPANSSRSAGLPPGQYKILGKVDSPNVLPFFGEKAFPVGSECASEFFIETKR